MHLDLLHKKGDPMKRLLILTFAIAAVTMMSESNASAQAYQNGYLFGAGTNANCNVSSRWQREQPPYFAQFPPVYYSHVVKRPYGISPYAAPAGIAPVEMSIAVPISISVKNPFFKPDMAPVKTAKPAATIPKSKST